MSDYQYKLLAAGRWNGLMLSNRRSNIGSEISRAIKKSKKQSEAEVESCHMRFGANRFNNIIANNKIYWGKDKQRASLKKIVKLGETVCDYFCGDNDYHSTEESLVKYFDRFVMIEK